VLDTRLEAADMNRSGWKHGCVAVLIGIVLGLGGLAGQPSAQAAAGSGVSSEGYSERRPCGDCYERDRDRACDDRRGGCPGCYYDRQPRCGDCAREDRRPCDRCEDRTPKNGADDRCADAGKSCERQGEPRQDDDDDGDGYKREKKDEKKDEKKERSVLHKVLRGVFD
jgi:hypothetical protein